MTAKKGVKAASGKAVGEKAVLMVGESYHNANMYYATRFLSGDDFVYLSAGEKEYVMLTEFEYNRAKLQCRVKNVFTFDDFNFMDRVKKSGDRKAAFLDTLAAMLKKVGVGSVEVPENFPLGIADGLRCRGVEVGPAEIRLSRGREVKTKEEIEKLREAQAVNEKAMARAVGMIRRSTVRKGILYDGEQPLTSERISREIDLIFLKNGYEARDNIVSSGPQSADPHFAGAGPIGAGQPVVIDIYPCSKASRYCGDMTRTVVKGKPAPEIKKMYRLVHQAQQLALENVRPGVTGKFIHELVCEFFEKNGYGTQRTGAKNGFIHGLGHGIGLDIHEGPSLNLANNAPLRPGNVVTVEPGLYDQRVGGVRLEDIVVVTKDGCENLNKFPKELVL